MRISTIRPEGRGSTAAENTSDLQPKSLPAERLTCRRAPRRDRNVVFRTLNETVSLSLGTRNRNLVVGEIVHLHVRDGLVDENFHVDVDGLDLVARLHGADWYTTTRDRFQVPRQSFEAWRSQREGLRTQREPGET